jgi:outer membrane biosynthesis protein TonB
LSHEPGRTAFREGVFANLEKAASKHPVTSRFHIEDLIVQDVSGVVFSARDSETGRMVAIRRFFPFGADGGGLDADEQTAYRIALGRLTGIHHPALRSVVAGGCDPVDGMPYIVTEWVEGETLDAVMDGTPLPVEAATLLISQALEVSELLSHILAEEAVWVETTLDTIIVSHPESGRGFTFWISPLKWLGGGESRGIGSIVTLAEQAMGWQGRIVNEQAGRGLGAWIKWLRAAAPTTSLREAREMLAASVGAEPPPPAKTLAAQASRPLVQVRQSSSRTPLLIALCGIVIVGAGVAWMLKGKRHPAPSAPPPVAAAAPAQPVKPAPVAPVAPVSPVPAPVETAAAPPAEPVPPPVPEPTPVPVETATNTAPEKPPNPQDLINQRLAKIAAEQNRTAQVQVKQQGDLKAQQAEVDAKNGVFSASHHELLVRIDGKMASVEGVLTGFDFTKNWMYLVLDNPDDNLLARGKVVLAQAPPDLTKESLQPLVGKRVRFRGKVEKQQMGNGQRPLIQLANRAAIQVLP